MQRNLWRAVLLCISLSSLGCSAMTVSSHMQRGLDFQEYLTYDWGPPDLLPTGDPRLDRNPFFLDHVQGAIEKQLATKGFRRSDPDVRPDLLVHYHAVISRRLDVNRVDQDYGYCFDEECRARVIEYEAGTLVVDIIDTRTNRLVWRGWAQDTIGDMLKNEDHMARKIDQAVTAIFARLPRSL